MERFNDCLYHAYVVLLETQSLRSHALYLFTEHLDLVVEQRVL
jgi:hypothetical protein